MIVLIVIIVVIALIIVLIRSILGYFDDVKERQKDALNDYHRGIDNQLRAAGHSEEYVRKDKSIRALKAIRFEAKTGYTAAWIGGIICLFVFPPLGLFITVFAIIATIREGKRNRQKMNEAARRIAVIRSEMPEK